MKRSQNKNVTFSKWVILQTAAHSLDKTRKLLMMHKISATL